MKMIRALPVMERYARYVMTVIAILAVIAVLLYRTGLVVTEAAWRSTENPPAVVCFSGKSLITAQHKTAFS
jgi:hypothetical protein